MQHSLNPIFNKRIFRDVVFENIDYDASMNFVIERVFERGDVEDIRNCRRYYVKSGLSPGKWWDKPGFVRLINKLEASCR